MVDKCVGCSQSKPDSHWIQCTSESCLMWRHTVCAGIGNCNTRKDKQFCKQCPWVCPKCVMEKNSNPSSKPSANCSSNLTETIKKEVLNCLPEIIKECLPSIIYECSQSIQFQQSEDIKKKTFSDILQSQVLTSSTSQQSMNNKSESGSCPPLATVHFQGLKPSEEEADRNRRKNNLIVFGLPESCQVKPDDKLHEDYENLRLVLQSKINLSADDLVNAYRLGSYDESKVRPFVLKFADESRKWEVLKVAKNLKLFKKDECFPIYFSLDRTQQERSEWRNLLFELRDRTNKGEKNLVIKRNKIISRDQPFQSSARAIWAKLFNEEQPESLVS